MASSIPGALNKTAGYRLLGDQGGGLTTELELRGQGVLCRSSARACEDYELRLSSHPYGIIQISINQTWVEVCPWASGYYVTNDAEISNICRKMGYDYGVGMDWITADYNKWVFTFPALRRVPSRGLRKSSCHVFTRPAGSSREHVLLGRCPDTALAVTSNTGEQCPWTNYVQCFGSRSPDTCVNSNTDPSVLEVQSVGDRITDDWYNLEYLLGDTTVEEEEAGHNGNRLPVPYCEIFTNRMDNPLG
eukprot:1188216-Prorocentrum_minimum.AAC.3